MTIVASHGRSFTSEKHQIILEQAQVWGLDLKAVADLIAYTSSWEFGVGLYEDDIHIHFWDDLSARAMTSCMAIICDRLHPDECRLLAPDRAKARQMICVRLLWD